MFDVRGEELVERTLEVFLVGFEASGLYLICSTHGALFEPINGNCVAGPCRGASLQPIDIGERDGGVFLLGGASEDEEQSAP